jgi:hypothetical protein
MVIPIFFHYSEAPGVVEMEDSWLAEVVVERS